MVGRTETGVTVRSHGRERTLDNVVARNVTVRILPAGTSADAPIVTLVNLAPGERQTVNYGIRPGAALFGRVILDKNQKAEGAPDVLIRVLETHHDAFTDSEGRFYIPDLVAGLVTIEVIEWSLPENSRPQTSLKKTVVLKSGKPVNAGVIVLDYVEPKVLQIFRPN